LGRAAAAGPERFRPVAIHLRKLHFVVLLARTFFGPYSLYMSDDLFQSAPRPLPITTPARSRCSRAGAGAAPARACISAGIDERALHHLAAEVLDNAMDEAVAGHATRIEVMLAPATG
jgi:topoisomerase-4 subunit B